MRMRVDSRIQMTKPKKTTRGAPKKAIRKVSMNLSVMPQIKSLAAQIAFSRNLSASQLFALLVEKEAAK
jgi:hypothetical protein